MNNFSIIYKILRILEKAMDYEEFDVNEISAVRLNITQHRLDELLIMMAKEGYVDGIVLTQTMSKDGYKIVYPIHPKITLKGLEYLEENSMMKKAAEIAKGMLK